MKMAEGGIKRMTELNKRRYPLLTMKTLLEFQKKHNIKSGLLMIQFNGNVGPKTNNAWAVGCTQFQSHHLDQGFHLNRDFLWKL
jgi:hypothetical protein